MGPVLLSVAKIWDAAPHNAFTDLVRFKDSWFCAFREGEKHANCVGRIRIIVSKDGAVWNSAALIGEEGIDLRDPHFSITSGGKLELVMGGTYIRDGVSSGRRPRVSVSGNGREWTVPKPILDDGDWLWRVTRRGGDGEAFGVSYRLPRKNFWTIHLMRSPDGENYREISKLPVLGKPNEATLRFRGNGAMIALVRREAGTAKAWIGASEEPFTDWTWSAARDYVGGPNFLIAENGTMWAAGRFIRRGKAKTALALMTETSIEPVLFLPSGGDCSYPGMVMIDDRITLSYYSSHEGKTSIYLAEVKT